MSEPSVASGVERDLNAEGGPSRTAASAKAKGKSRATMTKTERLQKNGKNWAAGVREDEVLRPHWDQFIAAKMVGGATLKAFYASVQNEFLFKIGWRLPDDVEPDQPLPEYDPTAPPIVETLSADEEKDKEARIVVFVSSAGTLNRLETATKGKRSKTATVGRAGPVKTSQLPKVDDVDDAVVFVANRLGLPPPKRASAGYQLYMTESFATDIAPAVARRWNERLTPDSTQAEIDALPPPELGPKVALELFNALEPERQEDLQGRAKAIGERNKKEYEEALKAWPPTTPDFRQKAQNLIEPLMDQLLRAVSDATGMHIFCVLGGPVPRYGGEIQTIQLSVGANHAPVPIPFPQWDAAHWDEVIKKFKAYLETAFTPVEHIGYASRTEDTIMDDCSLLTMDDDDLPASTASSSRAKPTTKSKTTPQSSSIAMDADVAEMDADESDGDKSEDGESDDSTERRRRFERNRQESIRKTQTILRDMGLLGATKNLFGEKPAKERRPRKEKEVATGPRRRSLRGKSGGNTESMDMSVSEGDGAGTDRTDAEASAGTEPETSESESDLVARQSDRSESEPDLPDTEDMVVDPSSDVAVAALTEPPTVASSSAAISQPPSSNARPPTTRPSVKSSGGGGLRRLLAVDAAKQLTAIPPCPENTKSSVWLCKVYPELAGTNLGATYNKTLAAYLALEAAYGYANGTGRLGSEHRPLQVHKWFRHKRIARPAYCAIPDTAEFSKAFWAWWMEIQPSWRQVTMEGRPGNAERKGESWGGLVTPGSNGVLVAVVMIYWWGCEDKTSGAWPTWDWIEAVEEVGRVCEGLREEAEEEERARQPKKRKLDT
ncbi:hypothetical protein C8F01DRAFT_1266363 [Mycena amicta]|nr:hypothetical protein C8F01DRAFT_1266363 [Mycena amicta]